MKKKLLNKLYLVRDYLFPKKCVDCGEEGVWWCKEHRHFLDRNGIWRCPVCKIENKTGATCNCCQKESYLDGVISFFPFFEPSPLSELLHDYKYNFVKDLESLWQEMLFKNKIFKRDDFWLKENMIFAPIPLFPPRERWRGFNQAQVLVNLFLQQAQEFYPQQKFISENILSRVKKTKQQAKLKKEERLENIQGAFDIKKPLPERVVLVDDVFTSGSTLQEAAKILKNNGVKVVWALTLFRAE